MMISTANTYLKYFYDQLRHRIIQTVIAYCLCDILHALENIILPKLTSVFCWVHSQNCEK